MINACDELLSHLVGNNISANVSCAVIGLADNGVFRLTNDDILRGRGVARSAVLMLAWNNNEWVRFLEELNFNYNNGYGTQHLFGTVWFRDGSWLEREEYDGAEHWVLRRVPPISSRLLIN